MTTSEVSDHGAVGSHDRVRITAVIGQHPPRTNSSRCLNLVHRGAECRRCAEVCPVDAISLEGAKPLLDSDSCVACGICIPACPTDVFGGNDRIERTLAAAVAVQEPGDLTVLCSRHNDPDRARATTGTVVTHSRCLGSLDAGRLLELSAGGKRRVVLDDTMCSDCPIGATRETISALADTANALLDADVVGMATSETGVFETTELIDGAHPHFTRRGLFGAIRDEIVKTHPGDDTVPASRERLLARLTTAGPVAAKRVPFADVAIEVDACTACGACVQFCPTDALSMTVDKESFKLTFLPAHCLDCEICVIACPESVVTYGPVISELNSIRTLMTGSLASCQSCETPTVARAGTDGRLLCSWCRHGAGSVRPLHDGAGLLDDLLGRINK